MHLGHARTGIAGSRPLGEYEISVRILSVASNHGLEDVERGAIIASEIERGGVKRVEVPFSLRPQIRPTREGRQTG
jgi:hypothetical protein